MSSLKLKELYKDLNVLHSVSVDTLRDKMVKSIYTKAEETAQQVVKKEKRKTDWDRKLDDILTSSVWGYPIMFLLLGMVFWITISGANIPCQPLF